MSGFWNTGFGKPQNTQERYWFAADSLKAKRPGLSKESIAAWVWCRLDNGYELKVETTAQRLADRRYNPFGEDN